MGIEVAELNDIVAGVKQQFTGANTVEELATLKSTYLGKKGKLTLLLKSLGSVAPEQRAKIGKIVNDAKTAISNLFIEAENRIQQQDLTKKLSSETVDVTLAGRRQGLGSLHPVTQVRERFEQIFAGLGFVMADGPEIENDYYNFTALNIPEHHPARADHDTFYFPDGHLLRTHTSPVQIRYMEEHKPPLKVIAAGKVFRVDSDATHTPMFHQLEGFVVDEEVTFADLKYILNSVLEAFFNEKIKLRMRPSYFPFTEPSAEVDFCCVACKGKGCNLCGSGWIEGLGCGMIHPNVLKAGNIDSEKYSGFAFGIGLDRMAMLYYKINDLRLLFENDLRFLEQF